MTAVQRLPDLRVDDLEQTLTQIDRATERFIEYLRVQSEQVDYLVRMSGEYDAADEPD